MAIAMKYKLVCIDIDGTLLDDEKRLHQQVKGCLQKLSKSGVKIALVSGRLPAGVSGIEKELGIPCIKVCNAGTYILMGENCVGAAYMPNAAMREIYEKVAQKRNIPLWIFRGKDWFVTGTDRFIEREEKIISYKSQIVDAEKLADQWDKEEESPNKLLLAADAEMIQRMYREIKDLNRQDIDIALSADIFIEIFPKGVDKGKALYTVCKKLNIDPEETIAIGDQELDIPMIEAAGLGIAMGNGISELKQKADFITKTNNEAGVAYALDHFFMGQEKGV